MRATRTAITTFVLALSGSLAAGLAGPAAAAPAAETLAPGDADRAELAQIRVLGDLGRLSELTGSLLDVRQDGRRAAVREARERLDEQLRRVRDAVAQARTARTLPAHDENAGSTNTTQTTQIVRFTASSDGFRKSVQRVSVTRPADDRAQAEAADALLERLEAVNTAAMEDIGVRVAGGTKASQPKSAVTTTLIDRQVLAPDRVSRYAEVADEIGDLVEDVREAPRGRLSGRDADEHTADLDEAYSELRERGGSRDRQRAETLEARSDALLDAARSGDEQRSRAETRRLLRETVRLLGSSPVGQPDRDEERGGADDRDQADGFDAVRQWTGTLLSPLMR